jgi:hypothetical protein
MPMTDQTLSTLLDLLAPRTVLQRNAENFWEAQKVILSNMETLSQAWFRRRREGTDAALQAAREMCECGDVVGAMGAYQRWLASSMGRIATDGVEAQALLANTAQAFFSAAQSAALTSAPMGTAASTQPPRSEVAQKREAA